MSAYDQLQLTLWLGAIALVLVIVVTAALGGMLLAVHRRVLKLEQRIRAGHVSVTMTGGGASGGVSVRSYRPGGPLPPAGS